jgi:uncharacterized Zn-finger protein
MLPAPLFRLLTMADHGTPHFHNQPGVAHVRIGAKEFMCIGALPPGDHPHVFIDMGDADDVVCPYCSTHYIYDPSLKHDACVPPQCAFASAATA